MSTTSVLDDVTVCRSARAGVSVDAVTSPKVEHGLEAVHLVLFVRQHDVSVDEADLHNLSQCERVRVVATCSTCDSTWQHVQCRASAINV